MISFCVLCLNILLPFVEEYTTYQSFAIDNREVVWAHTFQEDKNAGALSVKLFQQLKTHAWIRHAQFEGDDIIADIENLRVDYKRYGAKYMKTSNIIRTGKWFGKVRVMFRDNRYRVIVYGLHYVARQPERTAGKISLEAHDISGTLTDFALDDLRTSFKRSRFTNLDLIHMTLKDTFTFSSSAITDQEW